MCFKMMAMEFIPYILFVNILLPFRVFFLILQLGDEDQALYKNFSYVNSERWQYEIAGLIVCFKMKTRLKVCKQIDGCVCNECKQISC